jgi:hypothetical protein
VTLAATPSRHSGAAAAAALPAAGSSRPPASLRLLFVGLVLYAAFGKGFAYAGYPPVFVGELLLAVVLVSAVRPWTAIPRNAAALITGLLVGFAVVQFAVDRLDPGVPLIETVRGLAPIYYCAFAFGAYALLREYERRTERLVAMESIERGMVRALPWVLGTVAVLAALLLVEPAGLPTWPGSGISLLLSRSGDIAVALVAFAPALMSSRAANRFGAHRLALIGIWAGGALLVTFKSRAALLALIVGLVVIRPHVVRLVKGTAAAVTVVLVLYVTGLSIEYAGREISYDAAGDAIASVLGTAPEDQIGGGYVGTKNWRADFWSAIWADVRQERMVLHGHGWGDNLAVRHGFVLGGVDPDDPLVLRLPHSIFFALAGRAGVIVAFSFLLVPVLTVVSTFRSRAVRPTPFVTMAARGAVAAAVTTGLMDDYLTAPQGGILFWSLIGYLWWATAQPIASDTAEPLPSRPSVLGASQSSNSQQGVGP